MHLKNPIFGNSYTQDTNVIIRKLSSGETKIVYDPSWPTIERFHVEFRALSTDIRDTLLDFFRSIAGNEITLNDHENRNWVGFILDNPVVKREADKCMYYTEFTFEGKLV